MAVRPGQATEIDLVGDKLAVPVQFSTNFSAQIEIVSQEAQRLRCRVTVPADAVTQVGGLVLCTAEGATDIIWLMVDDLPTTLDQGTNHQLAAAQEVPVPSAVEGTADGTEADYYRVTLQAGQRLAADVVAARFGSACDPVVRLLDAAGNELLAVDDIEGHSGDCHFEYVAAQAGPVVIELRDNKYQSGVRYRLRLGDFPVTLASIPLGVQRGTTAQVRFPTVHPEQSFTSILNATGSRWDALLPVSVRSQANGVSGFGQVAAGDSAEYLEAEPNNDASSGTLVPVPSGLNGVISDPADRDVFVFPAKAGQQLVIRSTARSAGSPMFPLLRVLNESGQPIAESAIGDNDEVLLPFAAPADGIYQLQIDELTHRGGPQFVYNIEISDTPFRLSLKNVPEAQFRMSTPTIDGALAVDLTLERFGYAGPILLTLDPMPPGVELFNTIAPEASAEHRLFIAMSDATPVGALQRLHIVGRATVNQKSHESAAHTLLPIRTKLPTLSPVPGWHDGLFLVSATAAAPPIIKVQSDVSKLFLPRTGATTQLVVTAERLNAEYKDKLTFVGRPMPDGLSTQLTEEGDKFTIAVTGAANAPSATHSVVWGVYGTFGGRQQIARISIPVEVNDPLALTAGTGLQLKPATTEKLKVQLIRRGTDRQPVTLTFQGLPAGISIPETVVPADQDSIDVDVTAAAEAAAGNYDSLQVTAASQYGGQPVMASTKLTITVPAP